MPATQKSDIDDDNDGHQFSSSPNISRFNDHTSSNSGSAVGSFKRGGGGGGGGGVGGRRRPPSDGQPTSSTRTGQACDRCKRRKIRCDSTAGGCMPCLQNNTKCETTDRNTGTKTGRGYAEALEKERDFYRHQAQTLFQQLRELGGDVRIPPVYTASSETATFSPEYEQQPQQQQSQQHWSTVAGKQTPIAYGPYTEARPIVQPRPPPQSDVFARADLSPQASRHHFLGVSMPAETSVSPTQGTSLSIFGMKLDLDDCMATGPDNNSGARSYEVMRQICRDGGSHMGRREFGRAPLRKEDDESLISWYMAGINPWLPFLHAPDVSQLVVNFYTPSYAASPAETVIVHMMLAQIKYQMATRNQNDSGNTNQTMNQESDQHYLYALSFFQDMTMGRTLQDIQALCMICAHVRSFPKPVTALYLVSQTFQVILESGLHRSADSRQGGVAAYDKLTIEMRKRVFWVFLLVAVPIYGKLGRPMPVDIKDFDIEIPEQVNDDLEFAEPGTTPDKCRMYIAISFCKLTKIFLETYSTIYAVHRVDGYDDKILGLENKVTKWKEHDWPPHLKGPASSLKDEGEQVMATWLDYYSTELLLLLHHPSRNQSLPPDAYRANIETCISLASSFIQTVVGLWSFKSLDTTWSNNVTFIAAILTLLFCLDLRVDQQTQYMSEEEFTKLKGEMNVSLNVIRDIGIMLGGGLQLHQRMQDIIDAVLMRIQQKQYERTASVASAALAPSTSPEQQRRLKEEHQSPSGGIDKTPRTRFGPRAVSESFQPPRRTSVYQSQSARLPANITPVATYHQQQQSPQLGAAYAQYDPYAAGHHASYHPTELAAQHQTGQGYSFVPQSATHGYAAYSQTAGQPVHNPARWTEWVEDNNQITGANTLVALGSHVPQHPPQAIGFAPNLLPQQQHHEMHESASQADWPGIVWNVTERGG